MRWMTMTVQSRSLAQSAPAAYMPPGCGCSKVHSSSLPRWNSSSAGQGLLKVSLTHSRSKARASPDGSPSSYSTRNISAGTEARLRSMKAGSIQPWGCCSVRRTSRQHQEWMGRPLERASRMTSVKVPAGFCQVELATVISGMGMPRGLGRAMAWPCAAS